MEIYKPGMTHELIIAEPGSGRRYDLRGIVLKAGTIVLHPESYHGLSSFDEMALPHVDTYPKIHYPIVKNMEKQLNFKLDLQVLNDYGWKNNDSTFSGLMGLMQSRSIDFSATGLFLRHDRLEVMDSTAETFSLRSAILYRQPPLSSLRNIFLLPFSTPVWLGCALLYLLITLFLQFEFKLNSVSSWKSPLEIITIVLGSICQQGSYIWPESSSSKITIFLISVTSLFFYTSYSATIVAILQTPSTEIQTLSDLTRSPLTVGVQDLTYNRVNFKETFDRDVRSLYETKILSKKHNAYCSPSEGIKNVRRGFFAFQVEVDQGYKLISDTFEESEKCGLSEMTLFPMPVLVLTVTKRSGYRELFTRQLRWQREVGIMNRIAGRWLPQKPSCSSRGGGDYVRVGMSELLPAWRILLAGFLLAAAIFTLELIYNRRIAKLKLFPKTKDRTVGRHLKKPLGARRVGFNTSEKSTSQGIEKQKNT
ncbi:glutamate receptor ionotropic, delta-2-like [Nilaparvata lugens]|uniref:glutamate receptor ionotropic, delta-2-like n=1 Tax=Nilaparvata lugens TaxID=108931 RepID=UPI00193CC5DB|nr:glutamate receptor ionotropic, delta-2-like [Nilaparvata lugens]